MEQFVYVVSSSGQAPLSSLLRGCYELNAMKSPLILPGRLTRSRQASVRHHWRLILEWRLESSPKVRHLESGIVDGALGGAVARLFLTPPAHGDGTGMFRRHSPRLLTGPELPSNVLHPPKRCIFVGVTEAFHARALPVERTFRSIDTAAKAVGR